METLIKNWNPDENYWIANPVMKYMGEFKSLYDKDKTKGKEKSSKFMWAMAFYIDPNSGNPYRNESEENKRMLISSDFLNDPKFDWDSPVVKSIIEEYRSKCMTIAEKEFVRINKLLQERINILENTAYTFDYYDENEKLVKGNISDLERMHLNNEKIYASLKRIKDQMIEEKQVSKTRGNMAISATDKGIL